MIQNWPLEDWVFLLHIGIGMGNPGVFQGNPLYLYPSKPVPALMGTGGVRVYLWVSDLITLYNYNIKIKYLIYIK
jgi:hypothetical protein